MSSAKNGNGFDPSIVHQFVKDIERHFETLKSYQGEYMNRCKTVRDLIARSKDAAKEAGIPKKLLTALLKERELLRKVDDIRDSFEDDEDAEVYDQLCEALGDFIETPLGKAAAGTAPGDDEKDVRPAFLKEKDAASDHVEGNVTRLRKGIKGLPGANATEA
jgi:hypothetical protein